MKFVFAIFMAVITVIVSGADIYTKDSLKGMNTTRLLPLYYGDVERKLGLHLLGNMDSNASTVREEILTRADLTDTLMKEFREGAGGDIYFLYALLGLAEFGNPTEDQQQFVLSVIKDVWAKKSRYHSSGIELASYDGAILTAMGSYLAGHKTAESEPILLELLNNADFPYGLPFTLRMIERHPTQARLEALNSRGDGTALSAGSRAMIRNWINASITRIDTNLKAAEHDEKQPRLKSAPPSVVPLGDEHMPKMSREDADPTIPTSRFWRVVSVICVVTLLLLVILGMRKRRLGA